MAKAIGQAIGLACSQIGEQSGSSVILLFLQGPDICVGYGSMAKGKIIFCGGIEGLSLDECIVALPLLEYEDDIQQVFEAAVTVSSQGPVSAAGAPAGPAAWAGACIC